MFGELLSLLSGESASCAPDVPGMEDVGAADSRYINDR